MNKLPIMRTPLLLTLRAAAIFAAAAAITACSGASSADSSAATDDSASNVAADTVGEAKIDEADRLDKDSVAAQAKIKVSDVSQVASYVAADSRYAGGIMPVIASHVPKYAMDLINSGYDKFIVVDKSRMKVLLYDIYGKELRKYGMACSRVYGTKHKFRDNRTPEGFFSIEGKYDSTDWLYTNDDGYTSPARGVFGPRFLRLRTPVTMQVGIHGTSSPGSIGRRCSHGCIRLQNQNILDLFPLVSAGMPVIVLPSPADQAVNRREGVDIPYFPTADSASLAEEQKAQRILDEKQAEAMMKKREEAAKRRAEEAAKAAKAAEADSTAAAPAETPAEETPAKTEAPAPAAPEVPDSLRH